MLKIFSWFGEPEPEQTKQRDFRNVVLLQVLMIFSALLLDGFLELCGFENSFVFRDAVFLLLGGVYVIILWDLLRNFSQNKVLIYGLLLLILGTYTLAIFTVNPFYKVFEAENQRPYLLFIHCILFLIEVTVIYSAIIDIFSGKRQSEEKVWGSACIYLMIAISFGSLYDILNILQPGCMGVSIPLGLDSYTECIYYSMCVLAGQDTAYPDAFKLVRNIGIIEGVWGNLFIVLLVGRLLSQSD